MTKSQIHIKDPKIYNLTELPKELPEITDLKIIGRDWDNYTTPIPMNFRSFKGLPEVLPKLEMIHLYDSDIKNFESLTAKMPSLKKMWFQNCHIHNFKGIPKNPIVFSIIDCKIDSFEGLFANNINILDKTQPHIFINKKTESYSLYGIDRTTLQSILIGYFSIFKNFYNPAKLTPKGLKLLNNCINQRVYNRHSPLEYLRRHWPFDDINHTLESELKNINYIDWHIGQLLEGGYDYHSIQEWNHEKSPDLIMENWIYGHDLEEELFIPEKIDRLLAFYEKSPTELALQYRSNPKSLQKDQIDRLIHEADHQTLQILEDDEFSTLQKDDAVISQISQRFAINTENGKVFL